MVACPHDQDRGKTRHEREVRRPLLEQRTTQGGHGNGARRQMWHLQIEHQQRNGDGKDAVAERFQATGLFFDGPCSQFTAHCLSPSRHDRPLLPGGGSVSTCAAERCLPPHSELPFGGYLPCAKPPASKNDREAETALWLHMTTPAVFASHRLLRHLPLHCLPPLRNTCMGKGRENGDQQG